MRRIAIAFIAIALPTLALAGPSIVGSVNNWDPADPAMELQPLGENGYALTVFLAAGDYEYKLTETDAWDGNDYPWFNIALNVPEDGEVTFLANLGATVGVMEGDEKVAHQAPCLAGDFLDLWGGNEWDPAGWVLSQVVGTDLFTTSGVLPAGHHECKITLNGNWDQDTGANTVLDLAVESFVVFTYEFGTNTLSWELGTAVEETSISVVKSLY